MKSSTWVLAIAVATIGGGPSLHAQETSLAGKVTDATEAVMPGATITAVHVDSGTTFVDVSDAAGEYQIGAMRPGIYRVVAELSGFSTITHAKVELLLGQRAVLDFRLTMSSLQESITVTGVATRYGFYELGRFAATYRHAFGEAPSETLRGTARKSA